MEWRHAADVECDRTGGREAEILDASVRESAEAPIALRCSRRVMPSLSSPTRESPMSCLALPCLARLRTHRWCRKQLMRVAALGLLVVTISCLAAQQAPAVDSPAAPAASSSAAPASELEDPRAATSPAGAAIVPTDPALLSKVPHLHQPSWSPEGDKIMYTSDESGQEQVHVLDIASGSDQTLAPAPQSQSDPRWSPDGRWVLYLSDHAGDEMFDVYVVDARGGVPRRLTRQPGRTARAASWSPDGRQVVFASRDRRSPSWEIAVADVARGTVRVLTHGSQHRSRMSPIWRHGSDGDWIWFNDMAWSFTDTRLCRMRPDGSRLEDVTPAPADRVYRLQDVSPAGGRVLLASDAANGWSNAALLDVRSRRLTWLTHEEANIVPAGFSRDGRRVAYTRDVPLGTEVWTVELESDAHLHWLLPPAHYEVVPLRDLATRPVTSPFGAGDRLLALRSSPTEASEIVALAPDAGVTRLRANRLPAELASAVVQPVAVRYRSPDGRFLVHALAWIPPNLRRDGNQPAVVEIHGGPMDQTRPAWLDYIQVLAARGYIVISPNYRGSTGYDREFFAANRLDQGGADLAEVAAAADWLVATGYVDPKRIAVYGASNGAYLTLMALVRQPERWAAGIALYPFVDFATGFASEPPFIQQVDRILMGDPRAQAALWRDRSPLHFADRIRAPVMLRAGANDPRCPPAQARQMADAIRRHGGAVQLTIVGEQGHGSADVDSYADENTQVVRFLDQHLRPGGDGQVTSSP
ncbi:MAG: prolyl oligopeptidase family serine peptidase [Vitreoscilla sp.]